MRIAVSGTHCTGKSTLIDEFLRAHPDFGHEPEPYLVLVEDYGEEFSSEPCVDDFYRQLQFNLERLSHHGYGKRVIYERSPVDFFAYILALNDLKRERVHAGVVQSVQAATLDGIRCLDLIVFLPLDNANGIEARELEDPKLRKSANSRLVEILTDDGFGIINSAGVPVVEVNGSTAQQLKAIEAALKLYSHAATPR
jgi:hypothetical protein